MTATPGNRYLLEAILDQGIRNANFFNGRVLTADALQADQSANRQQHEQLGQALGTGIVTGLEVSLVDSGSPETPPVLAVSRGLALNRRGQPVVLPLDVTALTLSRQPLAGTVVEAGLFAACLPPKTTLAPPSDRGIYLLLATPASGYQEQAPQYGFGEVGQASGCGSRYAVEGIRFRLEELRLTQLDRLDAASRQALTALLDRNDAAGLSRLQNWLAHLCFGTGELADFPGDPLAPTGNRSRYLNYGVVDALRAAGQLTDCDVPLALLYWPVGGVRFVDGWAVRRRPVPPPRGDTWPWSLGRRPLEVEAAIWQFQAQLDQLLSSTLSDGLLATLQAPDYFRYLPPVGLLPVSNDGSRGFEIAAFFSGQPHREPEYLEGAGLRAVLELALAYEPLDVSASELVWLYRIRQNAQAIDQGSTVRSCVLFTSGQLPPMAAARYDVARWSYSQYPT
jgi:hypothetical protein